MLKPLKWLDEHVLEYLSLLILIIVPLYPKIPLADVLPGYIVRIRLDDLIIGFAFLVWIIWLVRKKVTLRGNPLFIPILIYLIIGFVSSLSAIFITKTVPLQTLHVEKIFLHWARRVEYFSVFFVFYSSIKSFSQIKKYIYLAAVVLLAVSIYGFGQKYLYWPAYSTMNREFSKGIKLYLTENARVLSTFGGHYDLAAYLMIVLTLFIPLMFVVKKWLLKALFFVISVAGFWLLILTVSRTSFLAYMVSITVAFGLLIYKKGWFWAISRWFIVILISMTIMLSFGQLSERFAHLLKLDNLKTLVFKPITKEAPKGAGTAFLDIGSKSDIPPSSQKPSQSPTPSQNQKPSDVYTDVPEYGSSGASAIAKPRVYSQNAIQYDLSTSIRLDSTWPKAIAGFTKNPLLGSGYSTLTKANIEDFTEAESTDNDFLRALGETGLLGFLSFYGIVAVVCYFAISSFSKIKDLFNATVVAGLFAATIGLLVNAFYIDVFVSSKVAYTYWIMVAILLSTIKLSTSKKTSEEV